MVMADKQYLNLNDILNQFIWEHRKRFEVRDNNFFALSFSDIQRYHSFLHLIQEKFPDLYFKNRINAEKNLKLIEKLKKSVPITDELQASLDEASKISNEALFQVESFFLFSKILLDKIARSIELYFGPVRKFSLDSHDDLVKSFPKYCAVKQIEIPDSFMDISRQLKEEVSDFRDYQIAHNKSPRTLKWPIVLENPQGGRVTLAKLYPRDVDKTLDSSETSKVLSLIENYIIEVMNLLNTNTDRTALRKLSTE